jgi:murein DD-endopeptidase MepM/ murein hydrolase activator NlpD
MARGKHRAPKDSSSTRRAVIAAGLGVGTALPMVNVTTAEAAPMSAWDRIAECESGGRWNLPYGDASSTGGLQIQKPTWDEYGGTKYAAYPYQASKENQIRVAEKILAGQGPGAWRCNAKMGYPLSSSGPNSSMHKGGASPFSADPPAAEPKPDKPKPPPAAPKTQRHDHYTVESGDTLYGITLRLHGDKSLDNWRPLYEANKERIKDPDLIFPGQSLNLPDSWSGKAYKRAPEKPQTAPSQPAKPDPAPAVTADYVLPVAGRVGDSLIIAGTCISRTCGGHSGLDISAPQGTPVRAAAAGTVVSINASGSPYGQHVVVDHGGGVFTLYAHMSAITVTKGQSVKAGTQVGNVGSTGTRSSGPHLHFEVRNHPTDFRVSVFLNPLKWLRDHGVSI